MILSPVESMKSIIKELVWFQNLCWSPLCSQSLHHEFLLLFLYLYFSVSEATRRHLHTNSHIKHQAVKTRTWRCNYSELRLSFCLSLIVLLRRCVYQPVNVLFLSMNSEMWMNFFRRFLTCHLVCAHMQHIVCVCVCVCVCVSRRFRNTPATDLIKVCVCLLCLVFTVTVWWLTAVKLPWCHCAQVIDSVRPAVVRVERLKQHVRSEAESAAWRFLRWGTRAGSRSSFH